MLGLLLREERPAFGFGKAQRAREPPAASPGGIVQAALLESAGEAPLRMLPQKQSRKADQFGSDSDWTGAVPTADKRDGWGR